MLMIYEQIIAWSLLRNANKRATWRL